MSNGNSWPLAPWRRQVLRATLSFWIAFGGFHLGRLSERFSGSATQWFILVLSIIVVLSASYVQNKRAWRSSNPVRDRQTCSVRMAGEGVEVRTRNGAIVRIGTDDTERLMGALAG